MKKNIIRDNLAPLVLLVGMYVTTLFVSNSTVFKYRFDSSLIDRYMLSQDIPHEVAGRRLFLSDGDIHIAAGYLYLNGNDPTRFNFQHPPFIKYLYGLSIMVFQNPLYVQMGFGIGLIGITYLLSVVVLKNKILSFSAAVLLLFDPLVQSLSGEALLDLGQAFFALAYVFLSIVSPHSIIWSGIVLGLLAGSKFWAAGMFIFLSVSLFSLVQKKTSIRKLLFQLVVAGATFSSLYLPTFITQKGMFNLPFFELKTVKYWFHHSVTSIPFASLGMFVTGMFKTWWGDRLYTRSSPWSFLWPIGLILSITLVVSHIYLKKYKTVLLISMVPIIYLVYLGIQAPFPRYFIFILPYLYIASVYQMEILLQAAALRFLRQNRYN